MRGRGKAEGATAFEAAGGLDGIRSVVADFYDRLFSDVMVGFFFHGHDKGELTERQTQLVARALGGDVVYEGRPIREAHAGLPILPGHFDRRHRILAETLADHGVDGAARDAWLSFDRRLRPLILTSRAT